MKTKVTTRFPKFYINKYGAFYEGQQLFEYCKSGNNYYYVRRITLIKFVTHYNNYLPNICFQFQIESKKRIWTLPCEGYLGIFYRKK